MKNKFIAIFLVLALCAALCGCQLALPDGEEAQHDRLIGCFITAERLDLFDHEAYLNDNADKLLEGGTMELAFDSTAYQGRIYAEYYEEAYMDEEGVSHTNGNYRFPELEGISYFAPTIFEKDGRDYVTFQTDEGLHEVNNHVKCHNAENYYTELSAKVYANIDSEREFVGDETIFYMYPVFQDTGGNVYLVGVNGGFAMNCTEPSTLITKTLSEEYTTNIDGEEFSAGGSVSIEFATAHAAEKVKIVELSAGAEVLSEAEFFVNELPESYEVHERTAYILLSAISVGGQIERSIVAPGGEQEDVFALVESGNGWLKNVCCDVLWEEER